MNTAKERIIKLVEEIPETKAGEVIDFLEYIKQKGEEELYLDPTEEDEILNLIEEDKKVTAEEVNRLLESE